MIVFLIGYMGSGKSTIGEMVAKSLGISFLDMDSEIERDMGVSVSDIFAQKGEEYFRELETKLLFKISKQESNVIVASGGGTPCFNTNMETMNQNGITIYLKWSIELLVEILLDCRAERPLIKGLDKDELKVFVEKTFSQREHYYNKADVTVICDGKSDDEICNKVIDLVKNLSYQITK